LAIKREDFPWFGQMSLPREISIKNGRLIQKPIREIENYYGKRVSRQNVIVTDDCVLSSLEGRCIDMKVNVRSAGTYLSYGKFEIRFADNGKEYSSI
jgi:beta-fructofuranosidase